MKNVKAGNLHVGDIIRIDDGEGLVSYRIEALVAGSGLFGEDIEVKIVAPTKLPRIVFFSPDQLVSVAEEND